MAELSFELVQDERHALFEQYQAASSTSPLRSHRNQRKKFCATRLINFLTPPVGGKNDVRRRSGPANGHGAAARGPRGCPHTPRRSGFAQNGAPVMVLDATGPVGRRCGLPRPAGTVPHATGPVGRRCGAPSPGGDGHSRDRSGRPEVRGSLARRGMVPHTTGPVGRRCGAPSPGGDGPSRDRSGRPEVRGSLARRGWSSRDRSGRPEVRAPARARSCIARVYPSESST